MAYFAAAGVALPTRQYVAPGVGVLVAMDDEQVTVNLNRIYSGLPGQLVTGPPLPGRAGDCVSGAAATTSFLWIRRHRSRRPALPSPARLSAQPVPADVFETNRMPWASFGEA